MFMRDLPEHCIASFFIGQRGKELPAGTGIGEISSKAVLPDFLPFFDICSCKDSSSSFWRALDFNRNQVAIVVNFLLLNNAVLSSRQFLVQIFPIG